MRTFLIALTLLAACGDMTVDPPSSRGPGGGAPLYCKNTADAYAVANGLELPYPANPQNPTKYDPSLPPPGHFHPCLSAAGQPTSRNGMACMVCTDEYSDYYVQTFDGSPCTQDTVRSPVAPVAPDGTAYAYVVCVPGADGTPTFCSAQTWNCY